MRFKKLMRILSGIQPTGKIHLGNYLGAIKQWLDLQQNFDCIFMVVDLHAMTIPYDPKTFRENIYNTLLTFLALGLNPEKCVIFIQSHIKEHTELAWILNTITPIGELERMTQFKEKSKKFAKNINTGLLTYPVLMAADILLYQTDLVPVGQDQKQHVELTRTIARKFNSRFGKTFREPRAMIMKFGAKIMSLTDPAKKMSKSDPDGAIEIFENPEIIRKKILAAVTDSGKEIKYDPEKKPGISNLLTIHSLLSGKTVKELEKEFKGKNYSEFKGALAETVLKFIEPKQSKKRELEARGKDYILEVLKKGVLRAKIIAKDTMEIVRQKTGLV